jgi:hypothetical protein
MSGMLSRLGPEMRTSPNIYHRNKIGEDYLKKADCILLGMSIMPINASIPFYIHALRSHRYQESQG